MHGITRQDVLICLMVMLGAMSGVCAQTDPSRAVAILVGYSPGGAVDIVASAWAQQLQVGFWRGVLVENKSAAGTYLAIRALIDSAPDGHTLMLATNALVANVSLFQPAVYDMSHITPIAMVGRVERQALSRLSADTNHCRVWICWIRRVGVAWAGGARRTPRAASSSPNGRWRGAAQGDCVVCRAFAA